jgi:3-isopropylmalate/(R)-2-methylmalate dehydratase small subunit
MAELDPVARGRCHKFGHDMGMDTEVLPHKYSKVYPFDAEKLVPHLFETVVPEFHKKVQKGDFIVAGRNFAGGKAHPQGLIAIAALGLEILCESMPFNAYRGAISRGIRCSRHCPGITELVSDGDMIRHDFLTGQFLNETTGATAQFAPIPERLLNMMLIGGMKPMLAQWAKDQAQSADAMPNSG